MALQKDLGITITQLLKEGLSNREIAEQLCCSSATVSYYRRKNDCLSIKMPDWQDVQTYYDSGYSLAETAKHFNVSKDTVSKYIKTRSASSAQQTAHKVKPRKHSFETKAKLREAMLRRLAEGTYPTLGRSNRLIGQPSYPEKYFAAVIENRFNDKQVVKELPFGIYSLDFAWPHLKKCIEIDGEQHYTIEKHVESDKRKNAYIDQQGWQILRIRWKDFLADKEGWILRALEFIDAP